MDNEFKNKNLHRDRIDYIIEHIRMASMSIKQGETHNGVEILESLNEELEDLLKVDTNDTYMKTFKGMNFQKWCELDETDKRKIIYESTPCGTFTSEDNIEGSQLAILQDTKIVKIKFENNEWHVWLK